VSGSRAAQHVVSDAPTSSEDYTRATLNVLEDFAEEKERFQDTQRAITNILEDFVAEKERLQQTERAIMNILEDFDAEKTKVEEINHNLRREVAERTAAEQALVSRTSELGRSNADLEQFAYVASHDLQEPLRMVSAYVQLFEKRYQGLVDAQAAKYIAYAVEGARRMQTLIAGLLEYSRVGRGAAAATAVALDGVLDDVLQNIAPSLLEAAAQVTRDPLPVVLGDRQQLAQVLQNLVANAEKFRRPGTSPHIHVSAARDGASWILSVADDGIGIEDQYFDRVFVIFQRLHTRAEYPGTGIGLSICKKVVERHGGRIWVESTPGRGTTFRFSLPAEETTP
jgi:light-regulated signal transduction histidine kinase (bacteriophytochrome)